MKTKLKYALHLALILAMAFSFTQCSKARKAGGEMDTPEAHYKQGMKYFNDKQVDRAEEEFNLALSLDKKFARAHAGLCLTTATKARKQQDKSLRTQAEKHMARALDLDNDDAAIWIAYGRMITIIKAGSRKDPKWYKDAAGKFSKAIKIDPQSGEAYFRRAMAYRKGYQFSEAKDDFGKVLDLKNGYVAEADAQWKIMQDIERAARSENGKKIALVEEIARADICVLFIDELNLTKYIQKRKPAEVDLAFKAPTVDTKMETETVTKMAAATDIETHWAKNFMKDVMDLGLRGLDPGPNHRFYPDSLINRGEFCLMLEDIVIAMTKEDIKTKHIGGPDRFRDIPPHHPYYNAVCNAVDRGYVKADVNGFIKPQGTISGAEALLIMRELRNLDKNLEQ